MSSYSSDRDQGAISPFDPALDHSQNLSRRTYNLLMGGLVVLGFLVIGACASLVSTPAFFYAVIENYLTVTIVSFIVSIAGVVVLNMGMHREGLAMPIIGYAMIVGSIGFTTGLVLPLYDIPSIANAFVGTALIAALFTLLGVTYPNFFQKIGGVLFMALLGVMLVSVASALLGLNSGWLDFVIVAVFAGFIGYDSYRAAQCEPTVKMAILNAVNIWLDLVNVFLTILRIVGNRD